ncbi:MAG TPA: AAA family ATPase [Niabella sp.]|nr:AAA family ATPase [Niabella sp.]
MYEVEQLIATIKSIKQSGNIKKYIDFIHFPFYRNLEIDTKINFEFPLTVFIGQNGCGKSSCLHALYGAPRGQTPYEFWFDTSVDPIEYYDDQRKRHSFWYIFTDDSGVRQEVVKARIRRNDDPNYWETSRPLVWAGMTHRTDGRRNPPIQKNAVYIDFRAELSAFDKYFYFGNTKGSSTRTKQEFIRKKSKQLQEVIAGSRPFYFTKAGKVNKPVKEISQYELKWISFILGKSYTSGQFLEHSFFRNFGYTVIFNTNFAKYSEAFAGSGEVAVVRLVLKILEAPAYSLILLDEPEVSLHPGAQERLKVFLLEQIKLKKHQIVITSHSASIVNGLPKEAIKVFYQNPSNGRFLVKENLTSEEAFYHIEFPISDRKNIIVEDILANEIVSSVLIELGAEVKNLFNVKYNPGGESVIKKEFIPVFCRDSNSNNFIFFDGDQKFIQNHYDWRTFSASDLTISFLKIKLKEQTREEIKFSVDSLGNSGNEAQQIELQKKYLDFYLSNVFYFPKSTPEDIIWDDTLSDTMAKAILEESKYSEYLREMSSATNSKKKFSIYSKFISGNNTSEDILATQKIFIQKWANNKNEDYNILASIITNIVK